MIAEVPGTSPDSKRPAATHGFVCAQELQSLIESDTESPSSLQKAVLSRNMALLPVQGFPHGVIVRLQQNGQGP